MLNVSGKILLEGYMYIVQVKQSNLH